MINKFFKTIHTKYSRFFSFIFFLRYLFAIFLISFTLFLFIPNFFNYEKKVETIKDSLLKNYNLDIKNYENVEFNSLPLPSLEIKNTTLSFQSTTQELFVKNLRIYPNFLSIYNYKDFQINKISLSKIRITTDVNDFKYLIIYLINQKKKLFLDNLELKIINGNENLIKLKNVKFLNYGYNKNKVTGELFGKKFLTKVTNDFDKVIFKLINTGVSVELNLDERKNNDLISGIVKSKILNSNLKIEFNYKNKELSIYNLSFRNNNLYFNNKSKIIFDPFLNIKSNFKIREINTEILKKLEIEKFLMSKNIIKKINGNYEINFNSKKFSRDFIDKFHLKIDLAHGKINYIKKTLFSDNIFDCNGTINLLEENPLLYFDCFFNSNDKQKLLKIFSLKKKSKDEKLKLIVNGNLNILNQKVNFEKILINENYDASKEDLKFFKNTFENILFRQSFSQIFNLKKIKEYILEVS